MDKLKDFHAGDFLYPVWCFVDIVFLDFVNLLFLVLLFFNIFSFQLQFGK